MKSSMQFCTPAWLLIGLTGSVPGKLKLSEEMLSFTAFGCGTLWKKELLKLEQLVGRAGIAEQMEAGKEVLLFDIPVSKITVNFPWYYFSGGMKIKAGQVEYRFSFGQPANTKLPVNMGNIAGAALRVGDELLEVNTMRGRGKAWRTVLAKNMLP
jgi:hypothetical protein